MTGRALVLAGLLLLTPGAPVHAHSFDPALLVLTEREPGAFDVLWRTSPTRVPLGRTIADDPLVPVLPARCRRVYPAEPPAMQAGAPVFWRILCDGGLRGERLVTTGTDPSHADVVVRVDWIQGAPFTGVLRRDAPALELPHEAGMAFGSAPGPLAWGYLLLGMRHILEGFDHLLFVLGLFLLVRSGGELVRTITAFTVAHSLSLALATVGVVTLPSQPVEALIAASIVLVAREVARGPDAEPTLAGQRPWVVAFAFGLLHGLGFAGALAEIGLPRAHAALALLAFNVGVEIGQLVFVVLLFFVAIPFRVVLSHAPMLRLLPAYAMGTAAMVWVVERMRQLASVLVVVLLASAVAPAHAARIPGGTDATTDCFAHLEVLGVAAYPPGEDAQVACTDCDPTCDKDGVASPNGSCTFEAALCLNQTSPGCTPAPLERVRARARQLVLPGLDATACGPFTSIALTARPEGLRPASRRVKATAITSELPRRVDRNRVKLLCLPRPAGESCPVDVREPCAESNPLRNAYFGDLHIHTKHSFDANAFDVPTTPQDAYAFARGTPVALPPLALDGTPTQTAQIDRPLDFAAVTDHSEFLGEVEMCVTPGSAAYTSAFCTQYRTDTPNNATTIFGIQLTPPNPSRNVQVCGPDGTGCIPDAMAVWRRMQLAADAVYDRTAACSFTSFVGYEYTAATGISTLHRNVIFRNERVPFPTTYFEQPTPQGLWAELANTCLDAGTGCDALVIPHNSNESNGKMFQVPAGEDAAQAAVRASMEPLLEIYQHKGDSECRNGLSAILGAPDELCDFEKEQYPSFADCGDGTGSLGSARLGCVSRRDFARGALLEGLKEAERIGVNPFQLGFIGSTDTHNGTGGFVGEDTFIGHRGTDDDTPTKRLGRGTLTQGGISFSPGGLAGVWAEENSRDSIFQALRRREAFATSGPRITARFFGGWSLDPGLCSDVDMVAHAYAQGVSMGSTLPAPPPLVTAPSFLVSALRDPGTMARPGTQLQRIQIVKGWRENDESHYRVYEVAGDALNGASVDTDTCATSGTGFDSLCAVWTDPDFDPAEHAFYYARVVENPTCRWSAYECNRLAPEDRPATCGDPAWPKTIQERAWTSPIWFMPQS